MTLKRTISAVDLAVAATAPANVFVGGLRDDVKGQTARLHPESCKLLCRQKVGSYQLFSSLDVHVDAT